MTEQHPALAEVLDRSLLLLDDDSVLRIRLGRALEARGFETTLAESVEEAVAAVRAAPPAFAVLDMRLEDGSGLSVVDVLREVRPEARIIMLTGYGNIATAVAAVKALLAAEGGSPLPPENPMSADRVRWEHIQRVYQLCNCNVSETARRLNMHRRTLQRILSKRAPR